VKYWEIIADNLSKAGWSWGCVSAIDSNWRNLCLHKNHSFFYDPILINVCGLLGLPSGERGSAVICGSDSKTGDYA
jgi:hypothetical protein